MQAELLNVNQQIRVVRLEEGDVRSRTDHFEHLKRLVLAHEQMYPDIGKWFREKVTPGVRNAERVAFIGYLDEKPAVSAVVKRGAVAKFCHLHITDHLQNLNLGDVFFSLMAYEVRDLAQHVYFTLPESVWSSKGEFFRSFNFKSLHKADAQYRLFEEELECEASFQDVWRAVATKLPKLSELYCSNSDRVPGDLLVSVQPKYVARIFDGTKKYELRRKFSTKWLGHRLNIYATGSAMELVGHATVRSVVRNSPAELWDRLGPELGCNRTEFENYTNGADEVYAIELGDVTRLRVPVSRREARSILNESLLPPQSYCTLKSDRGWGKAVSLSGLLQGAFRAPISRLLNGVNPNPRRLEGNPNVARIQMERILT